MLLIVHIARESSGCFRAHLPQIAGATGVGASAAEAAAQAQASALRLLAVEIEHGAVLPNVSAINFRVVTQDVPPQLSESQVAVRGAVTFGALGMLTIIASQWWIASQLARETGRSFAVQFGERPWSFLMTWTGVLAIFLVAGAITGGLSAKIRNTLERRSADNASRV